MNDIAKLVSEVNCYKGAIMADNRALADYFMKGVVNMVKEIIPTLDDLEARQVATMLVMMA